MDAPYVVFTFSCGELCLSEVSGVTITEIIAGADVKEKGIRMLGGIGILEDIGRPPGRLFGD